MTTVRGKRRRVVGPDTFADLTRVQIAPDGIQPDGITFAGTLTQREVADVFARMESADDDDQAARAALRTKLAAGDPDLCGALVRYVLGEGA